MGTQEFLDAVARLREGGFPVERDPAEAWPEFADIPPLRTRPGRAPS